MVDENGEDSGIVIQVTASVIETRHCFDHSLILVGIDFAGNLASSLLTFTVKRRGNLRNGDSELCTHETATSQGPALF